MMIISPGTDRKEIYIIIIQHIELGKLFQDISRTKSPHKGYPYNAVLTENQKEEV